MTTSLIYIIISVLLSATGQLLLKKGMLGIGPLTISMDHFTDLLLKIFLNPFVISGLLVYGISSVIWLFALSRVELSFAYPFVGLSFILMMFASSWFFAENISPLRIAGTLVIGLGVFIVSRS